MKQTTLKSHYPASAKRVPLGDKQPSKRVCTVPPPADNNVGTPMLVDLKSQAVKENTTSRAVTAAAPVVAQPALSVKSADKEALAITSLEGQVNSQQQQLALYEQLVDLYKELAKEHTSQRKTFAQMPQSSFNDMRLGELLRELEAKHQELGHVSHGDTNVNTDQHVETDRQAIEELAPQQPLMGSARGKEAQRLAAAMDAEHRSDIAAPLPTQHDQIMEPWALLLQSALENDLRSEIAQLKAENTTLKDERDQARTLVRLQVEKLHELQQQQQQQQQQQA